MKYRIIQCNGNEKFKVQEKISLFKWHDIQVYKDDFPLSRNDYDKWKNSTQHDDWLNGYLPTYELAKAKLDKIIIELKNERITQHNKKLNKKFKVIEVENI